MPATETIAAVATVTFAVLFGLSAVAFVAELVRTRKRRPKRAA